MDLKNPWKRLRRAFLREPYFATNDLRIGKNVSFGQNVWFNCRRVRIGDGTVFKHNVVINADVFEIGDYGTVYSYGFFPGPGTLRIGHNFWMGMGAVVDAQGGTRIHDNVCVGVRSQLWTHMKFGDVMYGCRFHSAKPMEIEDDAWLGASCLVSPVRVGARSLAMAGSLVTSDMESDRTYAGVPARDVTDQLGPQFEVTPVEHRRQYLEGRLREFAERERRSPRDFARIVTSSSDARTEESHVTVFNVADRTYRKRGTEVEARLMRFLLPDAKFVPDPPEPGDSGRR